MAIESLNRSAHVLMYRLQAAVKTDLQQQQSQYDNGPRFQACSVAPLKYAHDAAELESFIKKVEKMAEQQGTADDMQI
jgi:hypothetical protein